MRLIGRSVGPRPEGRHRSIDRWRLIGPTAAAATAVGYSRGVRIGMIGTGLMTLYHLTSMVGRDDTVIAAMCEPSAAAYDAAAAKVEAAGRRGPRTSPTGTASWTSPRASSSSTP